MSFDRYIVLWDTATGQMTEIEPPKMAVGEDNMGAVGGSLFRQGHRPVHTFPLGLARVQELLVAGAVGCDGLQLAGDQPVIAVFLPRSPTDTTSCGRTAVTL